MGRGKGQEIMAKKVKRKGRHLTTRLVRSLTTKDEHGLRVYDNKLSGFSVRVSRRGVKTFEVRYETRAGRRRRFEVGKFPPLTMAQARARATKLLALVADGEDPALEARRAREKPTFASWAETYVARIKDRRKSVKNDLLYLGLAECRRGRRKGEPLFPEMREWLRQSLPEIQRPDVQALFEKIGRKRGLITANRWLAAVRSCLGEAERDGLVETNAAWKVRQNRENPSRDRVLDAVEREALVAAIVTERDRHARAGLLLLLTTGARLGEVCKMQWADLNPAARTWKLPDSKNGRGRSLPLLESVVEELRTLPKTSLYVVAGRWPLKPRTNLEGPWQRVKKAAAASAPTILDLHIHDLRRSAGLEIYRTAGLHAASVLLGHKSITTTARIYAPLGSADLRAPVEDYGKLLDFAQKAAK